MGATAETWAMYKAEGVAPVERVVLFCLGGLCADPDNPAEDPYRPEFTLDQIVRYANADEAEVRSALNNLNTKGMIHNVQKVSDDKFTCILAVNMESNYVW